LLKQFTLVADDIDPFFPMNSLKIETQYAMVPIAGAGNFLLPHASTSEQCLRKTNLCYRNIVHFEACRKFGAETRILYGESEPK
jgi:hypothetical protein